MIKITTRIALLTILLCQINTYCQAQLSPINFETNGYGATWTWTTFENASNPTPLVMTNPFPGGINTSDNVIQFTALQAGQPWAGFESFHGGGIGTFTLDSTNSIVKVMVYKSVISDVGVKFATPSNASTGELKVANTLINQWEELTFDFTSQIGHPAMIGIDQIIIFPDFNLAGRTADNICYIDNIQTGAPSAPINVNFEVQNTDSTPVFVFGNWNNWNNFPGTPMTLNASGNYETTIQLPPNSTIEYLFVNGTSTKEVLDSSWACTNGNPTYTNRLTTLGNADTTFCNVWQSCAGCAPLSSDNLRKEELDILVTANSITLKAIDLSKVDGLYIYDFFGRQVYSSRGSVSTNYPIPINLQHSILYLIRVTNDNDSYTLKTIITH